LGVATCWLLACPVQAGESKPLGEAPDLNAPSRFSPEQHKRIAERDRLEQELPKLRAAGKLNEALASVQKMIAIDREVFGTNDPLVAQTLARLVDLHIRRNDFPGARKAVTEILAIYQAAKATPRWRIEETQISLGRLGRLEALTGEKRKDLAKALELADRCSNLTKQQEYGRPVARAQFEQALPLAQQAVEILKNAVGPNDLEYGNALFRLATIYRVIDRNDSRPGQIMEEAVNTIRGIYGEGHPAYAVALCRLSTGYQAMSRKTLDTASHAASIFLDNLKDWDLDYVPDLRIATFVSWGNDALVEALSFKAIRIFQFCGRDRAPAYADCLDYLSSIYGVTRKQAYTQAEIALKKAIDIRKESLGETDPRTITAMKRLASIYTLKGARDLSKSLFEEIARLEALRPHHEATTPAEIRDLAKDCYTRRDYGQAEQLYQQLLEIDRKTVGENNQEYYNDLLALLELYRAKAYRDKSAIAQASRLADQALQVGQRVFGDKDAQYAELLKRLAGMYSVWREYDRAEQLLQQSLVIVKELRGENDFAYTGGLVMLAGLNEDRGDYARADALYDEYWQRIRQVGWLVRPDFMMGTFSRARGYVLHDNFQRAQAHMQRLVDYSEEYLEKVFGGQSERERIHNLQQFRQFFHLYLTAATQGNREPPATEMYRHVLAWKDAAGAPAADRLALGSPELQELVEKLRQARNSLAEEGFRQPAPGQEQAFRQRLQELRNERENLESELSRRSEPYRRLKQRKHLDAAQVAAALPAGVALIDLLEFSTLHKQDCLLAFVLRNDRPPQCVVFSDSPRPQYAATLWHTALLQSDPARAEAQMITAATTLHRSLWQRLERHLDGIHTVYIAPDGALAEMPLAILPGKQPGSYLIDDLTLGYVTSGRQVVEIFSEPTSNYGHGLLAAGGIDYQADPGKSLGTPTALAARSLLSTRDRAGIPFLPGTEVEARRAGELFHDAFPSERATVLMKGEATEGRVKQECGRDYRYLHFATHGFFESPRMIAALRGRGSADNPAGPRGRQAAPILAAGAEGSAGKPGYSPNTPVRADDPFVLLPLLQSGILFAGAGREPSTASAGSEDGILTAEEVAGLDLHGTEQVVLSACDTALGKMEPGQGVLGLQRAFHTAGARTMIASLWKVDDAATSLLMEEYYVNLWQKKLSKLTAFRQAQLLVMHSPERVRQRSEELQKELSKLGYRRELALIEGKTASQAATGQGRASPLLWAAFVLSGDGR
jgi:CHAT domain-containing protein